MTLGSFPAPKQDQDDRQDDQHLGHAEPMRPLLCARAP